MPLITTDYIQVEPLERLRAWPTMSRLLGLHSAIQNSRLPWAAGCEERIASAEQSYYRNGFGPGIDRI